jgi:hypothetical protein
MYDNGSAITSVTVAIGVGFSQSCMSHGSLHVTGAHGCMSSRVANTC